MCEEHEKYMREAIALSRENVTSGKGGPFGAVVVKDGKIIGRGVNKVTAHNDPTAHAEVTAIREACAHLGDFSLKGCTLYSSCEPCPMCLSAIYWARIDHFYFGNTQGDAASIEFDDAFLYAEMALAQEARSIKAIPLLRDEAFEVFRLWADTDDKVPY